MTTHEEIYGAVVEMKAAVSALSEDVSEVKVQVRENASTTDALRASVQARAAREGPLLESLRKSVFGDDGDGGGGLKGEMIRHRTILKAFLWVVSTAGAATISVLVLMLIQLLQLVEKS